MSKEDQFIGRWSQGRKENIDAYLKANNVNIALRQVAKWLHVNLEVTRDGDEWTWYYTSVFKNIKVVFKMGEEFDETTADGKKMKSTYKMEDNALVCYQNPTSKKDLPSKYIIDITDDGEMVQHFISVPEDVRACRYFKRVPSSK